MTQPRLLIPRQGWARGWVDGRKPTAFLLFSSLLGSQLSPLSSLDAAAASPPPLPPSPFPYFSLLFFPRGEGRGWNLSGGSCSQGHRAGAAGTRH